MIRLDKYLSDMGIASRKELREIIKSGRVCIKNTPVRLPDEKFDPDRDKVSMDGKELNYKKHRYYMMDKPRGVLTAARDAKQKTVLDLLPPEIRRMGVFPVGRLDKDTSGFLILTDDGEFAHRVISPKSHIEKVYYAKVDGIPDDDDVSAFSLGLTLKDGTECLPAGLTLLGGRECLVTVMEGKYHQVRRMLASRGKSVTELRRLSIGGLKLDENLGEGNFRELVQDEIDLIFMST